MRWDGVVAGALVLREMALMGQGQPPMGSPRRVILRNSWRQLLAQPPPSLRYACKGPDNSSISIV